MLEARPEETKGVKWILEHEWLDPTTKIYHKMYISEDGRFGKDVTSTPDEDDEDDYEEMWKYD